MDLVINMRYLAIPISYTAEEKKILFYHNEQLVYDLVVRFDQHSSDTMQYVDMSRFMGYRRYYFKDMQYIIKSGGMYGM